MWDTDAIEALEDELTSDSASSSAVDASGDEGETLHGGQQCGKQQLTQRDLVDQLKKLYKHLDIDDPERCGAC